MDYFLQTNRLLFSTWKQSDLHFAQLLWGEAEVTKFISKNGVFSNKQIEDRLKLEIDNQKQFSVQYWPIFQKETFELIGCCGLRPYQIDKKIYEIGVHLRSKFWGQGFAFEAVSEVMKYAKTTLNASALFAGHNPNNINSKKVLQKLGFTYLKDEFYEPTGLFHPSYEYKL